VTDRENLRIGDAERDEVVNLLQHAVGDGRLTMAEGDERIGKALEARTFGDLDPLVRDLTPLLPSLAGDLSVLDPASRNPDRAAVPGASRPPGWSADDPLVVRAMIDDDRRVGEFSLPPYVRMVTGVGDATLVCLEARAEARVIHVDCAGGAGDIRLILPHGWAVRADRLGKGLGGVTIRVPADPAPGKPLLEVTGAMSLGGFVARPANIIDRWLLRRRRRSRARRLAIESGR